MSRGGTVHSKINKIHRRLIEERNEDAEVLGKDVAKAIKQIAGVSHQTVENYKDYLKEFDVIKVYERGRTFESTVFMVSDFERERVEDIDVEDTVHIRASIPRELRDAAKNLGANNTAIILEAFAEFVGDVEGLVSELAKRKVSDEEAEYIFLLLKHRLYFKRDERVEEAKVDELRRKFFEDVFGVDPVADDAYDELDELRRLAFNIAMKLGMDM